MELNGTCVAIIGATEYTKRTGEKDKRCGFVLDVKNGDFTNKVAFLVFGQERFDGMGIVVGGTYNVAFDLTSREWQGKWFTDARAFRVARLDNGASVVQTPKEAHKPVAPQAQEAPKVPSSFDFEPQSQATQGDIPF